jgi:NAD(P)-dependent dehydrogenase (short-subunit alcohol dehydrogenase family)
MTGLTNQSYIGPFLLVNRLLPLLESAAKETGADVRIINLSSFAQVGMLPANFQIHFDAPDCLKKPVREHPWQWRYLGRFMFRFDIIRYAVSKAAVACFAKELQRRLDNRDLPILSIAVHPGDVASEGMMEINNLLIRLLARASFLSPEDGATTSLFAATAEEVRQNSEEYKGKFLVPFGKTASPHPVVENDQQVERLWETTTSELNEQLAIEQLVLLEVF